MDKIGMYAVLGVVAMGLGFGAVAAYSMSPDARAVLFTVMVMGLLLILVAIIVVYAGRAKSESLSGRTVPMLAPQSAQPPVIVVGSLPHQPQASLPNQSQASWGDWTGGQSASLAGLWASED